MRPNPKTDQRAKKPRNGPSVNVRLRAAEHAAKRQRPHWVPETPPITNLRIPSWEWDRHPLCGRDKSGVGVKSAGKAPKRERRSLRRAWRNRSR